MFVKVNNNELAVDVFGEGEPILLVHGLGGSSNFWRPVINEFSSQFKLIVPDMPSAGRSENDPSLSISSMASDMLDLLDAMGIEKARVMGHSMGTIVCQHMTAMAPDRVLDLVLLGPLSQAPEPARPALKDRAGLAREKGMESIADIIADVALSKDTKASNPNVQGFVRELIIRQDAEGYALSCVALSESTQADPTKITCPTILITGDEDGVAPPANVEVLNGQLPNSEMHVLAQCGHWTPNERTQEVNTLIQNFYK